MDKDQEEAPKDKMEEDEERREEGEREREGEGDNTYNLENDLDGSKSYLHENDYRYYYEQYGGHGYNYEETSNYEFDQYNTGEQYVYNVAPEPIAYSQNWDFHSDKFLVFDIGSGSSKIGYAGEQMPRYVFDTVGLKVSDHNWVWGKEYFMDSNIHARAKLPMEWGIIRDWEAWEELISHCFLSLNEDPSEQPVFLTEPQKASATQRERIVTEMFETFNVPAFFMASEVVLSLYASFTSSGTVVHIGDGTTDIVPFIYAQGQFLQHAASSHELSGRDITEYLMMLLSRDRGYSYFTKSQMQIVKDIKENSCYLSMDFIQDFKRSRVANPKFYNYDHQLPNKQFVTLGAERFIAPEIIFRPFIDAKGIAQTTLDVINKCDMTTRPDLFKDIILTGGTTMTKGFKERFEKDLRSLAPNAPIHVHDDPNRHLLAWQGASMITQFPSFNHTMWLSRREYDEMGPSAAQRKCVLK